MSGGIRRKPISFPAAGGKKALWLGGWRFRACRRMTTTYNGADADWEKVSPQRREQSQLVGGSRKNPISLLELNTVTKTRVQSGNNPR